MSMRMMSTALMTMRWTTPSEKMMKILMKKNIINMVVVPMAKSTTVELMEIMNIMTRKEMEITALEVETGLEDIEEIIIKFLKQLKYFLLI